MKPLGGRTALITGAGDGAGRAITLRLADLGARVIASDADIARLEDLETHGIAELCDLDGTDTSAVYAAAEKFGRIDILVNCANYAHAGTVLDCDEVAWDYSLDFNAKSLHRLLRAFLPAMIERGGGRILNVIASPAIDTGERNPAGSSYAYRAARGAIAGVSEAVAEDFADRGIICQLVEIDADGEEAAIEAIVEFAVNADLAGDLTFTGASAHAIEGEHPQ